MLTGTSRSITVNFFTSSYRVLGKIWVGNSGLIGLLSDPNSSYVEVTHASLARLHEPKNVVTQPREIGLVKRGISVVSLAREADVGPRVVARQGYGAATKYHIQAISADFEMEGDLEWTGRFELEALMVEGAREYIPLYDTVLRAIYYPELTVKSPALIFNRRKIDILRTIEKEGEG